MTVGEWLRSAEKRLRSAEVASPSLEAQLLAGHVLRVDRPWLMAHPECDLNELAAEALLQRREHGEPLAYILGWREFYGRKFGVDPSVLVPRHETETLVEAALELGPVRDAPTGHEPSGPFSVLDMGTGSGILAITLKLERPEWQLTAVDVSAEALATASANARFLDAQVRFLHGDGFSGLLGESFDMIVSNPPYIDPGEPLPREVAEFEPSAALYAGEGGLSFYDRLAQEAPAYLEGLGLLIVELGHTQHDHVLELFRADGWTYVRTFRDLSGVERALAMRYEFEKDAAVT